MPRHMQACLEGTLQVVRKGRRLPAVIISHGFTGNHRETDPYGRYFAKKGYAAYTFDFCGGGPGSKSDGAMEHMTVHSEIADLKAVVSYVSSLSYINPEKITLMACSQGGFVSALTAGNIPGKIARLILFYPAISLADDARMGKLMRISYDPADPPEVITLGKMKVGRAYRRDRLYEPCCMQAGRSGADTRTPKACLVHTEGVPCGGRTPLTRTCGATRSFYVW